VRLLKDENIQGSVEGFYTEGETRPRVIFASCPDAITASDLNGNITDCNQACMRIEADKAMIKRVLVNLAVNGTQAMENEGTLKVPTKKTRGFVEVSFKDTDVGMSKEYMKKLFTPFVTTRVKGKGMSLPICKIRRRPWR
jgi:signal transduction histidine kinase